MTRKWKREVDETVPGVRAVIVASITDLERLHATTGAGPLFAIMSRERAKLSYRWQPAIVERWATVRGRLVRHEETGEPFRVPCCPDSHAQIVDKDGVPLLGRDLAHRKWTCGECGSPLWQADRTGPKRYPLADYVKHRMKGFFELLAWRRYWTWKSRGGRRGRPPIDPELAGLIRRMTRENPRWGHMRVLGELRKFGYSVSLQTVRRYRSDVPRDPSSSGRTFLTNHRPGIWASDFFTVHTLWFQTLYVFFFIAHDRRAVMHVNVTAHPKAEWVWRQLIQATPLAHRTTLPDPRPGSILRR